MCQYTLGAALGSILDHSDFLLHEVYLLPANALGDLAGAVLLQGVLLCTISLSIQLVLCCTLRIKQHLIFVASPASPPDIFLGLRILIKTCPVVGLVDRFVLDGGHFHVLIYRFEALDSSVCHPGPN